MLKGYASQVFNHHLSTMGSNYEIKLPSFKPYVKPFVYTPKHYFNELPECMKIGAILEWFDYEGITIETVKHLFMAEENVEYLIKTKDTDLISGPKFYKSRTIALKEAIKKANEYFNNNR